MSFNDIINTINIIRVKEFTLDPTNNLLYDFTKKEDINSFLNGKKSVFVVGVTKGVDTIEELESDYNKLIKSGKSPYIGKWGGNYDLVLTFNTEEEANKYDQDIILRIQGTEEFVEDEHPRDGDGQFATKDGGSSDKKDTDISRSLSTRMGRGSMDMGSHRIIEQYNKDNPDSQVEVPQIVNDLWQPMTEYDSIDAVDDFNEKHKEWKSWLDDNPQVKKVFDDMQVEVDEYNKILDDKFKNSKSFFRGSGLDEFSMVSSEGMLEESDKYSFQSLSMRDPSEVGFDSGVVIEYDADFIKDLGGVKTEYTTDIVPIMDFDTVDFMDKGEDIEKADSKVNSLFADEQEVRIENSDLQMESFDEGSIKSVTFNFGKLSLEKFLDRYIGNANVDVQRSTPKQLINSQKGWIGSQDSWVEQHWDEVVGIMKQVSENFENTWMKDVEFKYKFKDDGLFAKQIIESFEEDEHPRDTDGKFASGGTSKKPTRKELEKKYDDENDFMDKERVDLSSEEQYKQLLKVYGGDRKEFIGKSWLLPTGQVIQPDRARGNGGKYAWHDDWIKGTGCDDCIKIRADTTTDDDPDGRLAHLHISDLHDKLSEEQLDMVVKHIQKWNLDSDDIQLEGSASNKVDEQIKDKLSSPSFSRNRSEFAQRITQRNKMGESFEEDEHPRDGDGKFATKNGEDQSKTTRDITINNQLEYYEGIIEEYNEKIENTKKNLKLKIMQWLNIKIHNQKEQIHVQ